jgi:hypothetical protein
MGDAFKTEMWSIIVFRLAITAKRSSSGANV